MTAIVSLSSRPLAVARRYPWLGLIAGGAVALGGAAAAATSLPAVLGLLAPGALVCWLVFVLWPAAILPVGIIGGTIAGAAIGDGGVRWVVGMHALIVGAGCAAVAVRRVLHPLEPPRRRTVIDPAMTVLALAVVAGAAYGLTLGHTSGRVAVAAYEIAVIPAYFFLAMHTLTTPARLRTAAVIYVGTGFAVAVAQLAVPGRHGGLISLIAAPPLLVLATRTHGWHRPALFGLAAMFGVDVLMAAYRGIWLAAGVTCAVLLVAGGGAVRRAVTWALAGTAALAVAALAVSPGVRERYLTIGAELHESSGYRVPESSVGLAAFAARPFTGAGLGQSTPDTYLEGLGVTRVGPVYHAFYVTLLANVGLVGLLVVLWPLLHSVVVGIGRRNPLGLSFAALTCGFLVMALFDGPTDGHWELGLLPALTLLAGRAGQVAYGSGTRPAWEA